MEEKELKQILTCQKEENEPIIFFNTRPMLMSDISMYNHNIANGKVVPIELHSGEIAFYLPEIDEENKRNVITENLITSKLLKQIFDRFPDLQIFDVNKDNINSFIINSYKNNDSRDSKHLAFYYYLAMAGRKLKEIGITLTINIYISHISDQDENIQKHLNDLFDAMSNFKVRFFVEGDKLCTKSCSTNLPIEDYKAYSLKGLDYFSLEKQLNK
jgi:hypothetical protein